MSLTLHTCHARIGRCLRLPKPATSSSVILGVPIQFTISCTNQYVNQASAPLSPAIPKNSEEPARPTQP
jgi:hypothetical protein